MANRLITWAMGVRVGDAKTKALLVRLADGAREDGSHWPSQATLAEDTEIPRRTLQRRIDRLVELGLVRVEERRRANGGRTSNKYWLLAPPEYLRRVDDGDADLDPCAMVARGSASKLGAGAAPRVAQPKEPLSDPSEDSRSSETHARDVRIIEEASDLALAAFERVLEQWAKAGTSKTSVASARVEWLQWTPGHGVEWLEAACRRYLTESPDVRRHGPKPMQFWLKDEDFRLWLGLTAKAASVDVTPAAASAARFPDEDVREIASHRWGEEWARSWLDGSGWDPATRTITAKSGLARSRLRQDLWRQLRDADVKLYDPADQLASSKAGEVAA